MTGRDGERRDEDHTAAGTPGPGSSPLHPRTGSDPDLRARASGLPPRPSARRSWFSDEAADAASQAPQDTPGSLGQYREAVTALNEVVRRQDYSALPWIISVFSATADTAPTAPVLNNLGSAFQLNHVRTGTLADLESAVSNYLSAVNAAKRDSGHNESELVLYLSNLALSLAKYAAVRETVGDAEEAVSAARQAVEVARRAGSNDARRIMALTRLANALQLHARLAGRSEDDDESADVLREAVRLSLSTGDTRAVRPDVAGLVIGLGFAVLRRYERTGADEDLEEGISNLHTGVGMLPDGPPRRQALCHLALALRLRFRRHGRLDDLRSAISELLGVLEEPAGGDEVLGKALVNLTASVAEHVDCTNDPAQLRRVLPALVPALRAMPDSAPDRSVALAGYGAMMRRHFLYTSDTEALNTAVAAGEAATEAASDSTQRCAVLNSLVLTLTTRYEHTDQVADLDRAEELAKQAYELVAQAETRPAEQHPLSGGSAAAVGAAFAGSALASRAGFGNDARSSERQIAGPGRTALGQLGIIASHRYRRTSRTSELETAIELFERALDGMPDNSPERAALSAHLGRALTTLFQQNSKRKVYRKATRVLQSAANLPTAPAEQRFRAASLSGRLAALAQKWSEAAESFGQAVAILPLITRIKQASASPAAQRQWARVTADAAACALETGQPERAVELLEHGRVALLEHLVPTGGELADLRRQQPELVDGLTRLRRLLNRPAPEPAFAGTDEVPDDDQHERGRLADAWNDLLRRVRAESGHERHLLITKFQDLAPAAEGGPVTLINVSRFRSDALVVIAGRVLVIPLPGVSPQTAEKAAADMATGTAEKLSETLDWLWHNVTRPVLDVLGYSRTPDEGERWPRMWWCTSGAPAFLPLHAAAARSGECVLDRVICSYTPTLEALTRARQYRYPAGRRPVLIAASAPEEGARSTGQRAREQMLTQQWPDADVLTPEETRADLLDALARYPRVHIDAPSTQHWDNPLAGRLVDRGHPSDSVRVRDMASVPLRDAEFAYLARCGNTVNGGVLSAASVPLSGLLGFAGFTHVVSSLWAPEADDRRLTRAARRAGAAVTPDASSMSEWYAQLCAYVYAELGSDEAFRPELGAYAVQAALKRARAQYPHDPFLWACFGHTGP